MISNSGRKRWNKEFLVDLLMYQWKRQNWKQNLLMLTWYEVSYKWEIILLSILLIHYRLIVFEIVRYNTFIISLGSSFPKAKPKHGLSTVACLALQHLLFLPLYKTWWSQQTSIRVFVLFLLLYSLQLINVLLYFAYGDRENEADVWN